MTGTSELSHKRRSGGFRTWLALAGIAVVGLVLPLGCVGSRPNSCRLNSDCATGSFCDGDGFCYQECRKDSDCPCGSTCSGACGICVRDDHLGPATCVPFQHGLTTAEVLGACLRSTSGPAPAASEGSAGENEMASVDASTRQCPLVIPTLPLCLPSPPEDAGSDASDSATPSDTGASGQAGANSLDAGDTTPPAQGGEGGSL
jgi:hypothetical protein